MLQQKYSHIHLAVAVMETFVSAASSVPKISFGDVCMKDQMRHVSYHL